MYMDGMKIKENTDAYAYLHKRPRQKSMNHNICIEKKEEKSRMNADI